MKNITSKGNKNNRLFLKCYNKGNRCENSVRMTQKNFEESQISVCKDEVYVV